MYANHMSGMPEESRWWDFRIAPKYARQISILVVLSACVLGVACASNSGFTNIAGTGSFAGSGGVPAAGSGGMPTAGTGGAPKGGTGGATGGTGGATGGTGGATGGAGGATGGAGGATGGTGGATGGTGGATGGAGGATGGAGGATGGAGAAGGTGGNSVIPDDADPTETSASQNGPYTVQSYSSGFAVGPSFPMGTIWYPSDGKPPFTGIAIVPGFMSPRALIEAWGPFLASHNIVTFTIDTNAVSDQPPQRSAALLNAIESLKAENTRADSPLNGKLDLQRLAVGGWSMGGGGTLITVNGHPELKAGMAMCAWDPGGNFSQDKVPTLMFASSGDPLAGGQSQGFYRSIPQSTPKMLFEWGAGDHFMANAPTGATNQVGRYGLSWLKVFLVGDERYRQFLQKPCDGCTDFQSNL